MSEFVRGFLWFIGDTPMLYYFAIPIPFYALGIFLYTFSFKSKH